MESFLALRDVALVILAPGPDRDEGFFSIVMVAGKSIVVMGAGRVTLAALLVVVAGEKGIIVMFLGRSAVINIEGTLQ